MTFNPNIPNASQSPGLFPAQNNTNYARTKTIINSDHVFNDSAQASDGYHRQMHMFARAIPVTLDGASAILYAWVDANSQTQLRFYNGAADYPLTPPYIVAMVNFNGTGALGNQTIRSQLNVSTVSKTGTGAYTINFATPLANTNYVVQLTGMRSTSGDVSNGFVLGGPTYTSSVSTTSIKIQFNGGSGTLQDVLMGNVVITSVG